MIPKSENNRMSSNRLSNQFLISYYDSIVYLKRKGIITASSFREQTHNPYQHCIECVSRDPFDLIFKVRFHPNMDRFSTPSPFSQRCLGLKPSPNRDSMDEEDIP